VEEEAFDIWIFGGDWPLIRAIWKEAMSTCKPGQRSLSDMSIPVVGKSGSATAVVVEAVEV
jgi:hypothetical protein